MDLSTADLVLQAFRLANNVYSLRPPPGTKYVTVRHQQVRASNLVRAFFAAGVLARSPHVVIVGAGVAGVTAACALVKHGLSARQIKVLERQEIPMWNLQHGHTRWLHPWKFLWPNRAWKNRRTRLPVANWSPGYACNVWAQLFTEFARENAKMLDGPVRDLELRLNDHKVEYRYELLDANGWRWRSSTADVCIIADGMGLEATRPTAENSSYWLDDNLHREDPYRRDQYSTIVVGNGDGALTDVLRLRLASRNRTGPRLHREIVEDFLDRIDELQNANAVRAAVAKAEGGDRDALVRAYQQIARKTIGPLLGGGLLGERRVLPSAVQLAPALFASSSSTFPVHRLMIALLELVDKGGFEFVQGRAGTSALTADGRVQVEYTPDPPAANPQPTLNSQRAEQSGERKADRLVWRVGNDPTQRQTLPEGMERVDLTADDLHWARIQRWSPPRSCHEPKLLFCDTEVTHVVEAKRRSFDSDLDPRPLTIGALDPPSSTPVGARLARNETDRNDDAFETIGVVWMLDEPRPLWPREHPPVLLRYDCKNAKLRIVREVRAYSHKRKVRRFDLQNNVVVLTVLHRRLARASASTEQQTSLHRIAIASNGVGRRTMRERQRLFFDAYMAGARALLLFVHDEPHPDERDLPPEVALAGFDAPFACPQWPLLLSFSNGDLDLVGADSNSSTIKVSIRSLPPVDKARQ